MSYPQYARIGDKRIKLNTDYKTALRCFDIVGDDSISDTEKVLAVVYLLYGRIPEDGELAEYFNKAKLFLQCGKTTQEQSEKAADIDFNYDRKLINASFMSDYHIDLENGNMHFWQFCELIQGLTEKCILSRVRYIRNCDIKDIPKESRADMLRAKEEVALPRKLTKEEQELDDLFEAQMRGEK